MSDKVEVKDMNILLFALLCILIDALIFGFYIVDINKSLLSIDRQLSKLVKTQQITKSNENIEKR